MVAISLYRGNLHKVPDVPRRWLMPNHTLSLKDFKSLLRKRDKTLSRLRSTTTTTTTSSNPNPNPNPNPNSTPDQQKQHEFIADNVCSKQKPLPITTIVPSQPKSQSIHVAPAVNLVSQPLETVDEDPVQQHRLAGDAKDQTGSGSDNCVEEQRKGIRIGIGSGIGDSFASPDAKSVIPDRGCEGNGAVGVLQAIEEEKQPALPVEISNNVDLPSDKEKKKRDLEQNLKVLNERKHNLVQMLKQILNAEEEIKRRSNMQLSAVRPSGPQQVEATADLGSNPRQVVNRVDAEANFCGDLEGESEDLSNHNANACQPRRMRSISPSSSSPLRKVAPNSLQHTMTSRPSIGVTGHAQTASGLSAGVISSPSRFAPSGQQGQPVILPPLSVSGTHCTASSPSPAASGGTSVFRDARITSPSWN